MAAHDFENLLQVCFESDAAFLHDLISIQCAIPVFDGLLPEPHNGAILKLLFVMAHWHGLAKLRMHNDLTLDVMDAVTVSLGDKLRAFSQKTCAAFETKELPREAAARVHRETKKSTSKCRGSTRAPNVDVSSSVNQAPPMPNVVTPPHPMIGGQSSSIHTREVNPVVHGTQSNTRRRNKTFNINTYKLHSFGDYVATIRQYGTMDSYSTEPVCDLFDVPVSDTELYYQGELEHRSAKSRYTRTSRKHFVKQLMQIEHRQAVFVAFASATRRPEDPQARKLLSQPKRIMSSENPKITLKTFLTS